MKRSPKLIIKSRLSSHAKLNRKKHFTLTRIWILLLIALSAEKALAQIPVLSYSAYSGPQSYVVGTAITTLTPSNSGGTIIAKGSPTVFAGSAYASGLIDGTGVTGLFNGPQQTAIDASGNMYVADYSNNVIRKVTSAGVVTTLAGNRTAGSNNGTGTAASFNHPTAVCTVQMVQTCTLQTATIT